MLSLLLLCSVAFAREKILRFVQSDFDTFVESSIAQEDQERFRGYYTKLQEQIEIENQEKQKKTREYLFGRGFVALERDHTQWHKQITRFIGPDYLDVAYDSERTQVREFVYWHGALEEYKQAKQDVAPIGQVAHANQEKEKAGLMNQAKSYVAKATQKMGNWFKGLRQSATS